jgi:hypothetical protein
MEPGDSILLSQGLSNNPYPEPNQPKKLLKQVNIIVFPDKLRRKLHLLVST